MVEVKFVILNNEEFEPVFKEFRLFAKEHPEKIGAETVALAKSKYLNLIVAELAVANEYASLLEGLKNVLVEVQKVPEKTQKLGQKPVQEKNKENDEFDDEETEDDESEPEEIDGGL